MSGSQAPSGAATHGWRPWRSRAFWGFIASWVLLRAVGLWVFRTRNPAVIGRVKQFNRRWLNPWMLRHAGGRHWYAGRLEHRGRSTGSQYATPLWVDPVSEGFVMPLPYGRDVDWARNLLAAGEAVLQDHGVRYRVGNPRIVPSHDVLPELSGFTRRMLRLYGIDDIIRVDVLPNIAPPGSSST